MSRIDQMVLDTRGLAAKVAAVHGGRDPELLKLRDVVEELASVVPEAKEDQAQLEELLVDARKLTDGYQPPVWACRTLTRFYEELAGLDQALTEQLQQPRG